MGSNPSTTTYSIGIEEWPIVTTDSSEQQPATASRVVQKNKKATHQYNQGRHTQGAK
jgi:hypothetical protein